MAIYEIEPNYSDIQASKLMFDALIKKINAKIIAKIPNMLLKTQELIIQQIRATDTFQDLIGANGTLSGHFGFPAGSEGTRVDAVVSAVAHSVIIEPDLLRRIGNNIEGGFSIKILKATLEELLVLDNINPIYSENTGTHITWIDWLLTKGDQFIIQDFKISFIDGAGRSMKAVMIDAPGRFWRVPPKYAGIPRKNWITKVLLSRSFKSELRKIIKENITI